jgi:drug/metabolite transporter (DMT)-like permease
LVSFLLYVSSLKMISATSASLLSCFEPITAVVLSVALLGAPLTPAEGVGGVLVFAAVWLLVRKLRRKNSSESFRERAIWKITDELFLFF